MDPSGVLPEVFQVHCDWGPPGPSLHLSGYTTALFQSLQGSLALRIKPSLSLPSIGPSHPSLDTSCCPCLGNSYNPSGHLLQAATPVCTSPHRCLGALHVTVISTDFSSGLPSRGTRAQHTAGRHPSLRSAGLMQQPLESGLLQGGRLQPPPTETSPRACGLPWDRCCASLQVWTD